jgi:type I restriction enzyme S subunit
MEVRPGYKQTEVGVIPEDWDTDAMLRISRQIMDYRGRTPKKLGMEWGDGDIPALSAGNVKKGLVDFSEECYFGSDELYGRWMTKGDVARGDILFTTEAPLGNVALVPDDRRYILSQRIILLQVDPQRASSTFLFQMMLSDRFQHMLADYSSGSTAKGIQRKQFEQLSVALPPLPEQRAIAAALSDVDALLGGLDRIISKKRDLKQAVMQQLLTGQTRLPSFHDQWEVKVLSEVCSKIQDGTHQTPRYVDSGIPFYSVEHVTSGDFKNTQFISEEEHRFLTRSAKIEKGDILMTRIGSIGDCKLIDWDVEASFYVSLALLKIRPGYSAAFIAHYSNTAAFKNEVELHSLKSAIPMKINLGPISDVQIELPPTLAEQTAIAAVLSDMDAELAALEARRDKTHDLKQAMMQELLTGRTRLI